MKTIIFYLAFFLVSILLTLSSNAKQVQVSLKVNEELIYEWIERIEPDQKFSMLIPDQHTTITSIRLRSTKQKTTRSFLRPEFFAA
jgi:hypothetical protein